MSDLDSILSQLPIDQIAGALGVSPDEVQDAASKAVPALVGGMAANAADGGEQSLADALQQHAGNNPQSLDDIDVEDGSKIVSNVFGDNSDQVVQHLGATTPGGGDLLKKLLPMLAPMVMAFLAGKVFTGHKDAAGATTAAAAPAGDGSGPVSLPGNLGDAAAASGQAGASGGGLSDILGSVLGGGAGGSGSGGGIGDILGGLLGGGAGGSGGGGGIGDILGGLLGGGKK
ncbi:hypothetical protein ATK17_0909 [Branchiibius hedensis]|uniref:DUF937 domain-containing protein n=1 Tax=Branchiibius hedensis TaxID=672460 RepID=A0A2Y8ZP71_9MICO|nr:DUF937 domain-containing protein [Branchiibius hedensis]PWJ24808.1 hypothetical protein ATK17_0909 [Branchiibius hedensis]SSA33624.1 hypothetical protein SAMN04489750_0909 [Branchiibius hedensis]